MNSNKSISAAQITTILSGRARITALEFTAEDILFVLSNETLLENYPSMDNLFHNPKYKTMAILYTFLQMVVDIFKHTSD